MNKEFGNLIQQLRKQKNWTVKEFIEELDGKVSPAYMTKVEVYDEIPSPELICKMADVLGYDQQKLLHTAKEHKKNKFEQALDERYQRAVGLYRLAKGKKNEDKKSKK